MHYRYFNMDMEMSSRGGATIAILPADNNKVLVSIARCNTTDVFNKKVGRAIASGRLIAYLNGRDSIANKVREVVINDPLRVKESVATALQEEMDALAYIDIYYE